MGELDSLRNHFRVSAAEQLPEVQRPLRERGRITAQGRSTDDNSKCTLLVIHEADGLWSIQGRGAPGVTLSKAATIELVEAILARAR